MPENLIVVDDFLTYTIGIVVYFLGMRLTGRIDFLRAYNIPEPVTGGILRAEGKVVSQSKNLYVAESVLYVEPERQVARGSGTFMRSGVKLSDHLGYR